MLIREFSGEKNEKQKVQHFIYFVGWSLSVDNPQLPGLISFNTSSREIFSLFLRMVMFSLSPTSCFSLIEGISADKTRRIAIASAVDLQDVGSCPVKPGWTTFLILRHQSGEHRWQLI